MTTPRPLVTLLTDFGTADGYVGELKGVLATGAPEVEVVDIAHDLPPQDVEAARLVVARYWRRFPEGTIHLVVVDPGVGTSRAAIAVSSAGRYLVGPDNGVLSPALLAPGARAVTVTTPAHASATFHGRDVFAPVAASLARGVPITEVGTAHASPAIRRTPQPLRRDDGALVGEIIAIDHFGNAITNCIGLHGGTVEVADLVVPLVRTYGDVMPGEIVALVGSSGLVEIAERNGSAARRLNLQRGAPVVLRWSEG